MRRSRSKRTRRSVGRIIDSNWSSTRSKCKLLFDCNRIGQTSSCLRFERNFLTSFAEFLHFDAGEDGLLLERRDESGRG